MQVLALEGCGDDGAICEWLFTQTDNEVLSRVVGGSLTATGRALVILAATAIVAWLVRRLVRRTTRRLGDPSRGRRFAELAPVADLATDPRRERRLESLSQVVVSIAMVVVWTIGIMIALGAFDINLGPLIASAGVVGVAVGFGAQSLVEDFLSGLFMLAEDQFGVGDVIDVGEASGVVESLSLRTTSLRAVDGTLWHVPNGEIRRVGNMSQDWARAVLDIGVAYDAGVDRARDVISAVAMAMATDTDYDRVILEEPDVQGVQDLSADAVVIRLSLKTLPGEQWTVAREMRRRIKLALDDADIAIPFPQRQVWIRSDGTAFGEAGPGTPPDRAGGDREPGDSERGDAEGAGTDQPTSSPRPSGDRVG